MIHIQLKFLNATQSQEITFLLPRFHMPILIDHCYVLRLAHHFTELTTREQV